MTIKDDKEMLKDIKDIERYKDKNKVLDVIIHALWIICIIMLMSVVVVYET